MKNQNPLLRLEKHHGEVGKSIEKMNSLVDEIEEGGLEALQLHHHDLVKLRQRILNDSMVHFQQEEDVLFPIIVKNFPDTATFINSLLFDHQQIRTLYHDLLQAINEEKPEDFVGIAQSASEALKKHIIKEDTFLGELGGGWIAPEKYGEINHRLNLIEQEYKEG